VDYERTLVSVPALHSGLGAHDSTLDRSPVTVSDSLLHLLCLNNMTLTVESNRLNTCLGGDVP